MGIQALQSWQLPKMMHQPWSHGNALNLQAQCAVLKLPAKVMLGTQILHPVCLTSQRRAVTKLITLMPRLQVLLTLQVLPANVEQHKEEEAFWQGCKIQTREHPLQQGG